MIFSEIYQKGAEVLESKNLTGHLRGVETEFVLKYNEEVFKKYKFLQRAINSIEVSTTTKLLGVELKVPIIMSSISGTVPQIHPNGWLELARALKETGSMMSVGSPISAEIKDLIEVGVPLIQTVKPRSDRSKMMKHIAQAEADGVTWIGVEVDAGQGTKILDLQMAKDCSPVSVNELREIKQKITRPLFLKGILSPWDAEKALDAGADVIMVSNHGGRTIDYLPHPFEVMDQIVEVIGKQIPIIVDGGFRRGTDVLKGLAFGAQAVGVLRPILYALAADGTEGVKALINGMADELKRVMFMTGVKDPSSAHKGILLPCG